MGVGRDAVDALGRPIPPLAVGLIGVGLARVALLPGLGLWDTGELQVVGPLMGTAHPTGYPTYVLLGWLASVVLQPLGDPAFRMNLLAALFAGATAALVTHLVRRLTRRVVLAVGAGLAVATLPVVWRLGTHADVHGLHGLFVALLLVLLVEWESRPPERRDRWLLAAAVAYGLSLGNQGLSVLLAPGIAFFVLAVDRAILGRRRFLAACALAVVLPMALVYLELPIRAGILRAPLVYGHPDTLVGFLYVVTGAQFASTFDAGGIAGAVGEAARRMGDQLGPLAILAPVAAVVVVARWPRYALLTVPTVLLTAWFAAAYVNAEIDRYWLGPAVVAVTWLALAADAFADALTGNDHRAPVSAVLVEVAACLLLLAPFLVDPAARFADVDRSRDDSASRWLDATFSSLPADAVVVSWWDYSMPMWYGQFVEGRRPDLLIVDDRTRLDRGLGSVDDVIDSYLGRRPVFIIRLPHDMPALEARYRLAATAYTDHTPVQVLGARAAGQ